MGYKLTPDLVVEQLEAQGVNITRRTLLNWEKAGLIPKAKRGSYGQGGGKWADYPTDTIPEALTAQILKDVYRFTNKEVAEARKIAYEGNLLNWRSMLWQELKETFTEVDGDPPVDYHLVKDSSAKAYEVGLFPAVGGLMRQALVDMGMRQRAGEVIDFSDLLNEDE